MTTTCILCSSNRQQSADELLVPITGLVIQSAMVGDSLETAGLRRTAGPLAEQLDHLQYSWTISRTAGFKTAGFKIAAIGPLEEEPSPSPFEQLV